MEESIIEELSANFENLINLTKSDIDLNCEYPYLIFNRDELIKFLTISSSIIQIKSDNFSYNSISLVPNSSSRMIYFYATNELSHIRLHTELLGNKSNFIEKNISIQYNVLQKLMKLMAKKVLLYLKNDSLYIRLVNGDLLLDYNIPNLDIVLFPSEKNEFISTIDVDLIGNIVNNMLPLLNSDIQGNLCKISFLGDVAYYRSAFYYIESRIKTPKMSLSLRDSELISNIYKFYKGQNLVLYSTKSSIPRLFASIDNIDFDFISRVDDISLKITEQMNKVILEPTCFIELENFYKTLNLASTLPNSNGDITICFEDDKLILTIISNKGNSDFTFTLLDKNSDLYKSKINLKANVLKKLLQSFSITNKIGIAISDLGITITNDNIKAVLIHI